MNSYCLLGDYVYGFFEALFVEMYVNVVLVKLFVQRNELQFSSV